MTISEFLLKVATDEELRKAFFEDPVSVASEHGLDEEALKLISAGTPSEIRYEVKLETEVESETAVLIWIHVLPWIH